MYSRRDTYWAYREAYIPGIHTWAYREAYIPGTHLS